MLHPPATSPMDLLASGGTAGLVGLAGFILAVPTLSGQGRGMREGVSRPVTAGPRFWFSSGFKHLAPRPWEAALGGDC